MQGDVETAKRSLEDAIDLKDNGHANIAARLALANLFFVQGNYASALDRQVTYQTCMSFTSQTEHVACTIVVRAPCQAQPH